MWSANGQDIKMCEGDFGITLPITISGATFADEDTVKLTIKSGEETSVAKEFSNISQNKIDLTLTEAESELLPVGSYVYTLDWYKNGAFLCNIIPRAAFMVVDKA